MSSELTSKIKYSNRCMAHRATRHTMFWSGVLQEVMKFLEDEDVPACLPCTSAGLNVRLGAGTVSRRSAHYIMTALPSRESVPGAVSKD